jgi:hypothetical protein
MACEDCETAQAHADVVYPVRVGKYDIGYSNILLIGCPAHVQIAIDKLRETNAR